MAAKDDPRDELGPQPAEPLRRDLNNSMRFVHTMAMQSKNDLVENTASLYALIEELVARGVIDLHTLEERRNRAKAREGERAMEAAYVKVSENVDKYKL